MKFVETRIFVDQAGTTHCLELTVDQFLLDGVPVTIEQITQDLVRFHTTTTTVEVSTSALGAAFVGAEPTKAEIGVLFAAYLHLLGQRSQAAQAWRVVQEAARQALSTTDQPLPLPSFRFDALTERLLGQFDGTAPMTRLIANILGQPPEVVEVWAAQVRHRDGGQRHEEPACQTERPTMAEPCTKVQEASSRIVWTPERLQQLEDAFMESRAPTAKQAIAELVERFGWAKGTVQTKVFELGLPRKKREAADRARCQEQEPRNLAPTEDDEQVSAEQQSLVLTSASTSDDPAAPAETEDHRRQEEDTEVPEPRVLDRPPTSDPLVLPASRVETPSETREDDDGQEETASRDQEAPQDTDEQVSAEQQSLVLTSYQVAFFSEIW